MNPNHAVIELHLDDAAAEKLRRVWDRLKAEGIDARMPTTGARPHVSLAAGTGLDFGKAADRLERLCARRPPLRMVFPYLGLFPGSNSVGFLGVAHSEDLMALHTEVFGEVEGCYGEVDSLYRPSVLVMHSTLALAIPGEQLSAYWRAVTDSLLPGTFFSSASINASTP